MSGKSAVEVDDKHVAEVLAFLRDLELRDEAAAAAAGGAEAAAVVEEVDIETECQAPVKRVDGHRRTESGGWEFLILFANSTAQWVPDEFCECEVMIKDYFKAKNLHFRTAYCFCRVSTKAQASADCVSLEAQKAELLRFATGSFDRVKVYTISASAYRNTPTALVDIGEAASEGDCVYIYRVDRLSRNIVKCLSWIEEVVGKGADVVALKFGEPDSPLSYMTNRLAFTQAILDAEKESFLIGQRVRASLQMRRMRGDESVGGLQYGKMYTRGEDGVLRIIDNPEEQAIIARIKSWRGHPRYLAQTLNGEGIKKKNRKWTEAMVRRMM